MKKKDLNRFGIEKEKHYYQAIENALDAALLEKANDLINEAKSHLPNHPKIRLYNADLLEKHGRLAEANLELKQAASLLLGGDDTSFEVQLHIKLIRRLMRAGIFDDGERCLSSALEKWPKQPALLTLQAENLNRIARNALRAGRLSKAQSLILQALIHNPDNPILLITKAKIQRAQGLSHQAEYSLKEASAALHGKPEVRYYRAVIQALIDDEMTAQSEPILAQALAEWPKRPDLWALAAEIAHRSGEMERARASWQEMAKLATKNFPGVPDAFNNYISDLIKCRHLVRAWHVLEHATRLYSENVPLIVKKFQLAVELSKVEVAQQSAQQLLALDDLDEALRSQIELYRQLRPGIAQPELNTAPNEWALRLHENSNVLLIIFTGAAGLGLPFLERRMLEIHEHLSPLSTHLAYVTDNQKLVYANGLASFGADYEETLTVLREKIASTGATRVFCFGASSASHSAIRYGMDLGAEGIIVFGAITSLTNEFWLQHTTDKGIVPFAKKFLPLVQQVLPEKALDLRELMLARQRPVRIKLHYGLHHHEDRRHAEHLAGLPGIELCPADSDEHGLAYFLYGDSDLAKEVTDFIAGS